MTTVDTMSADLADALRALLAHVNDVATTGNAADDDVKVQRSTAIDILGSAAAIRAKRILTRYEWAAK